MEILYYLMEVCKSLWKILVLYQDLHVCMNLSATEIQAIMNVTVVFEIAYRFHINIY